MPTVRVRTRRPVRPSIEVTVADSESPLNAREYAHFLYLFRAAYVRCLDFDVGPEQLQTEHAPFRDRFSGTFNPNVAALQVATLFTTDLEADELEFPRISKSSPLDFICYGIVPALIGAAILSGGKVDLKFMKVTLPPLGVGIRSLREAFRMPLIRSKKRKNKQIKP
jgi:hypothetical protein